MFSVGIANLYLVPTINGDMKYLPKAQVGFFIRPGMINWKQGRPVCNATNFYISIGARIS